MTYQDEVLADAPLLQFKLDTDANNTGSSTATVTKGAGVTFGHAGATTLMGGTAAFFPPNVTTAHVTTTSVSMGGGVTHELWYKKNTAAGNNAAAYLYRHGSSNPYRAAYINQTTNVISYNENVSGTIRAANFSAVAGLNDGNWHHIVITKSNTDLVLYVDGVQANTAQLTSSNSSVNSTYMIGYNTTSAAPNCYMDEVAVYNSVLSASRVAAHYEAATVVSSTSITAQSPAVVINLSAPAVGVTAIDTSGTKTTVPAATINLSAPAVGVTAVDNSPVTTVVTSNFGRGSSTTADQNAGKTTFGQNYTPMYLRFDGVTIPAGHEVVSASLKIAVGYNTHPTSSHTVQIRRVTSDWQDGTYTAPTFADDGVPNTLITDDYYYKTGIDVTNIAKAWANGQTNYGIRLGWGGTTATSVPYVEVYQHDTTAVNDRPTLTLVTQPIPAVETVVAVPPAVINLTASDVTVRPTFNLTVPAGTASGLNVEAPDVTVSTTSSIRVIAEAATLDLDVPGGEPRNPDFWTTVDFAEAWVLAPNANGFGGEDVINTVEPATIDLSVSDVVFSNKTEVYAQVTPARLDVQAVGIYIKDSDRYIKAIQSYSTGPTRWFPLDEVSGSVANDIAPNVWDDSSGYHDGLDDAVLVGAPVMNVAGPFLRPAIRFDGVDDYINTNQPAGLNGASLNIEFSIKTTQENGTFTTGVSEHIRMVDGELTFENRFGNRFSVNKYIADGEWHHVVIVVEHQRENMTNRRVFVVIDGQLEFTRYLIDLDEDRLLPKAVMAQVINGVATDHLAGDLSNLLIRVGEALTLPQIQNLYYEWSGALRIGVPAITVSVAGTSDNRAKGNIKKMLVLYGGPYRFQGHEYKSIFANYNLSFIETFNKTGNTEFATSAPIQGLYNDVPTRTPRPFRMNDMLVYAVGYVGNVRSAPGIVKPGVNDPGYGNVYLNDKTGDPRFINLQNDLAVPVTEFSVFTVMNYPTDNTERASYSGIHRSRFPGQRVFPDPSTGNLLAGFGAPSNYDVEREKFRDTILQAVYDGANLWINEPHAAVELGIITQWEAHETMGLWNLDIPRMGIPGDSPHTTFNIRAAVLDELHGVSGRGGGLAFLGSQGDYRGVYQGIAHREIVNTQPGLTDLPSWDTTERVDRDKFDYWAPNANTTAYDVRYFPHLAVGDKVALDMHTNPFYTGGGGDHTGPAIPRTWIVSALPNGIVGKIISKEPEVYYTANTTVPQSNPWKDNVFTIICERGTVLKGRSIKGRIFTEFMDALGPHRTRLYVDSVWKKTYDEQGPEEAAKIWSFDEMRYSEIIVIMNRSREGFNPVTGVWEQSDIINFSVDQAAYAWDSVPHQTMSSRGLSWLSDAQQIPSGEARVYAPASQVTMSAAAPTQRAGRNVTSTVNGAARIDLDMRDPANVDNPNVREKVLPVVITVEARGIGKHITVPVAEIALTTPNPTGRGGGDRIYVYLEAVNTATIYLKEE